MSMQVSSGSGLSGLPLSLVSTEASVNWMEIGVRSISENFVFLIYILREWLIAERLPRLTVGASSLQGPNA